MQKKWSKFAFAPSRGLGDKNCKEQSDGIASICERHAFRTVLSFDLGKAMQKKAKKIADEVGVFLLLIG